MPELRPLPPSPVPRDSRPHTHASSPLASRPCALTLLGRASRARGDAQILRVTAPSHKSHTVNYIYYPLSIAQCRMP
eukprot:scaffold10488_cov121-Isochrysis_galbana.AAC.5